MVKLAPRLIFFVFLASATACVADARFDLTGPKLEVRVSRSGETLDIAQVPNLQPGDRLWLHPDLPPTQSVKYLLICVFLRGTTNPPPDNWFVRIDTSDKKVRTEGTFVTVPSEATQAVLLLAPETGGDFSTLKSAVKGRPGIFVRADQDLIEAGFEQARIEMYMASIRRVPPSDAADLQKHSDLLARTLALKPNEDCFKRPVDMQFTCLTQTGSQTLLDDGHGQSIAAQLSNGPNSDFINAASYTSLGGAGLYSAYVGAIVDLVRIMANLHTAQYQYIPAIAFPQGASLNLRLNTPPSFHNPKSVLVIGLPAIQKAIPPPLRPADAKVVSCLLAPEVTLPIEGAPLVFSSSYAHDLRLKLNTPPGAPEEEDIPLVPDAYQGGLVLQHAPKKREMMHEPKPLSMPRLGQPGAPLDPSQPVKQEAPPPVSQPEPVLLTGSVVGQWGFDPYIGPTVQLQQLPGQDWHLVADASNTALIAGRTSSVTLASTGTACVHVITANPNGAADATKLAFKPATGNEAGHPANLTVTLPLDKQHKPGDLHLAIQQYGQPKPDELSTRTFAEPAKVSEVLLHAGDTAMEIKGSGLDGIASVTVGDLTFQPAAPEGDTLRLSLAKDARNPPTKAGDHLEASIALNDGRSLTQAITVLPARPSISLLSKAADPAQIADVMLGSAEDLPLTSNLTFTIKSAAPFPRDGQLEVATLDGTLHATLTLAPAGGLLLQDPHTVVATLSPSRSFGASAFGALHMRALFPGKEGQPVVSSDWVSLVTLVRLPAMTKLDCPTDTEQSCTLSGSSFFLIQAVSSDPAFGTSTPVPDGYTGATLAVPHPAAGSTLFFKLRDDPAAIDSATVESATSAPALPRARTPRASKTSKASSEKMD